MSDKSSIHATFLLKRENFTLDVNLQISGKGITVIQGASGSGKTTILRCIAGLETPDKGYLSVNGVVWQDGSMSLPPYQRPIGYVFQEDSLFDHLTAEKNILFGCKERSYIPADFVPVIDILGISHLLNRMPSELSGGERQRVALARALAVNPMLLLMDEPLSSLDKERKEEILPYLEKIRDMGEIPIIYVTHDPNEARRLSARCITMKSGCVIDFNGFSK